MLQFNNCAYLNNSATTKIIINRNSNDEIYLNEKLIEEGSDTLELKNKDAYKFIIKNNIRNTSYPMFKKQ